MPKAKLGKAPDWLVGLALTVAITALWLDLFSLGIVLFEMVAGESPLGGNSSATITFQIAQAEPANLAQRAPGLPPELYAIVGQALRKAVHQRFQTGAEFAAALRACVARAPAPAG